MKLVLNGNIDDEGFHTMFSNGGWKILKGSLIAAKGQKISTLCTLKSKVEKLDIVVVAKEESRIDLWQKIIEHMIENPC